MSFVAATTRRRAAAPRSPGRKVKGTIHWVSAKHARHATVRLYDRLFSVPFPGDNVAKELNPGSLKIVTRAAIEPKLFEARPEERFQFERLGYFVADARSRSPAHPFSTAP